VIFPTVNAKLHIYRRLCKKNQIFLPLMLKRTFEHIGKVRPQCFISEQQKPKSRMIILHIDENRLSLLSEMKAFTESKRQPDSTK